MKENISIKVAKLGETHFQFGSSHKNANSNSNELSSTNHKRHLSEGIILPQSTLAKIQCSSDDPFVLLQAWYEEVKGAKDVLSPGCVCLSTATKCGQVTSRMMVLRRLDNDGLLFMTNRKSRKSRDLAENPVANAVFFWVYMKNNVTIMKQVKVQGRVEVLDSSQYVDLFEREPLYCKIRSHICNQGEDVDWDELKEKHDTLLKEVTENGTPLPMPEDIIWYRLVPDLMDFYEAYTNAIADRLLFTKTEGAWERKRIAT